MSAVKVEESSFELNVRFRLDNIHEFLDVPAGGAGPPRRVTDTFGHGWLFSVQWFRTTLGSNALGVYLYPPHKGYPVEVVFSVRGESLNGTQYFNWQLHYTFPIGKQGYGWSNVLQNVEKNSKRDKNLRTEDALIIVASLKTPEPRISSEPMLDFVHSTITDTKPSDTKFVAFSRRTPSGRDRSPRTFLVDRNVIRSSSAYIDKYFQGEGDTSLMHRLAAEESMMTTETEYTDVDSDFAEEADEVPVEDPVEGEADELPVKDSAEDKADQGSTAVEEIVDPNRAQTPESERMQIDTSESASSATIVTESRPVSADQAVQTIDLSQSVIKSKVEQHAQIHPPIFACASPDTHIVTGVASTTWEALLFYLYTGIVVFAPLTSEGKTVMEPFVQSYELTNQHRPAPCSCKSMYRLADKMGLENLRDRAREYLKSRLTKEIILTEVFSTFTSRYEEIQKIEFAILMENWNELDGTSALSDRLDGITDGVYPHARWVLREWLKKLSSPAIPPT